MEGIRLEEMMDIMQDAAAFRAAQDYVRQTMIQSGYLDTRAICAALRLNCSELKQENERLKSSGE